MVLIKNCVILLKNIEIYSNYKQIVPNKGAFMTRKTDWSSPNANNTTSTFHGTPIIEDKNGKILRPITRGQEHLLKAIEQNDIIFVNGPPGCGKSAIATWYGIAAVDRLEFEHLILTRPILEAGENLGFLPGTIEEKVAPYMAPLFDFLSMVKGENPLTNPHKQEVKPVIPMSNYKKKKEGKYKNDYKGEYKETPIQKTSGNEDFYKKVNVCPLAYLRGTTKARSFILLDEAQNCTKQQIRLMLGRIGVGSKLIITGDINQVDLARKSDSGFVHAQKILKGVRGITSVTLSVDDICRHRLVKDIIIRYTEADSRDMNNSPVYRHIPEDYDFSDDVDDITEDASIDTIPDIKQEAPVVRKLPKKTLKKVVIPTEYNSDLIEANGSD